MARAREAASSARLCALLIAVATSSVNSAIRVSVAAENGSGLCDAATLIPHTRPSTWIGTATDARIPRRRISAMNGPVSGTPVGPNRTGRAVSRSRRSAAFAGSRSPTGTGAPAAFHTASSVMVSSGSNRSRAAASARTSWASSWLTTANSSSWQTPRATSVATRRRAACSATISCTSRSVRSWLVGTVRAEGQGLRCCTRHAGSVALAGHDRVSDSPVPVPSPAAGPSRPNASAARPAALRA